MNEIDLEIPAHLIRSAQTRQLVVQKYQQRWHPQDTTPITQPWLYDPLDPPQGWYYDPCYEIWCQA